VGGRAVVTAGALCLVLARAFSRLTHVVPSGAGLPAFLSRAFGRRLGLRMALPYLLLMIALAGVETRIVGVLLRGALGVPAWCGAAAFLLVAWAVCRRGIRPGYRVQIAATAVLVVLLGALAVVSLVGRPPERSRAPHRRPPPRSWRRSVRPSSSSWASSS
jgi:amino acid transporter